MRSPEDRELAEKATHDPEAFGALYDRYFGRIYRLIYLRVRQQALAEELTTQVFFKALEHIKRRRHAGSRFASWLGTLALTTLARKGYPLRTRREGPSGDNGLQSAGCPAPLRPRMPSLSGAAAAEVRLDPWGPDDLPLLERITLTLRGRVGVGACASLVVWSPGREEG
ncbi:MAG TPA: sigma factor [Candidatus Dormibacteraeota bacterium]